MEDDQQIRILIHDLESPDHDVRVRAIKALGESNNPKAAEPLISCLGMIDRDWIIHEQAAHALGKLRSESAIPALISVLKNSERQGGGAVAQALGNIGTPALPYLIAIIRLPQEPVMYRAVTNALAHIGPPAVDTLIGLLTAPAPIALCAIRALGRIRDPRAVEPLISMLDKATGQSRLFVYLIDALSDLGDHRAVDSLIKALQRSNLYTLDHAIRALYFIGDKRALPELTRFAEEYQNKTTTESFRYWLKQALSKFEQ